MRIGTHSGPFHADDAFACAALRLLFPEAEVLRTRDQAVLDSCDIVLDVGGVHDAGTLRFDHHQRGGAGTRENEIPYASAGLIWRHFGASLVEHLYPENSAVERGAIWLHLEERVFQGVDAIDCGYRLLSEDAPEDIEPRYRTLTLSHVVGGMNPRWDEDQSDEVFMAAFEHAMEFSSGVLLREMAFAASLAKTERLVREAPLEGQILVLDKYCPWNEALFSREDHESVLYVVFPQRETWMIFQVPVEEGSFTGRLPLPEAWAGLRDGALAELIGVTDATFVHAGRFCGGAASRKGAVQMAQLAITSQR